MKKSVLTLFALVFLGSMVNAQAVITAGPAPGSVNLVPFTFACLNTTVQTVPVCGGGVSASFNFTSVQCCACPSSGKICAPGSVTYGGPGSSGSFINYHTLSYSPSNEHQQFVFSSPITTFQFSTAGPASGAGEWFRIDVYNGATFLNSVQFYCPGPGIKNTYYVTAPAMTRLQFTEIQAISADDELMGDVFIDGPPCPVLPFNLLDFAGTLTGPKTVRLDWRTETETENDYFIVQRSADGHEWETIDEVDGNGTTEEMHSYSTMDFEPYPGVTYYRLKQVDFNGESHLSHIVAMNINEDSEEFKVYPNPATDRVYFHFGKATGNVKIDFVNEIGQVVKSVDGTTAMATADISDLNTGLYFIRIENEGRIRTYRLLKQ